MPGWAFLPRQCHDQGSKRVARKTQIVVAEKRQNTAHYRVNYDIHSLYIFFKIQIIELHIFFSSKIAQSLFFLIK